MLESIVAVYRSTEGVTYYLVGGMDENELLLASVLSAFMESLSTLLRYVKGLPSSNSTRTDTYHDMIYRNKVDKRSLLENWETLLLTLDEMLAVE